MKDIGNSIEDDIRQQEEKKKEPKKLSALAAKKDDQESSHDRAARFFATHGMKDIGSMLGDTLSADAEQKVVQQANNERQKLAQSVGRTFNVPSVSSSVAAPSKSDASMDDGMDIPLDDED